MSENNTIIRKEVEFQEFLKLLRSGARAHWQDMAKAIGVNKDTITEWKQTPEAREAIQQGIEHALLQMQKVGKKDWKMWESKLKMLGISPIEKQDITSDGKPVPILGYVHSDNSDKEASQS